MITDADCENSPRWQLENGAVFIRICPFCGRFVEPDVEIKCYEMPPIIREPNATCSKHGGVEMPFEGYL